MLPLEFHRKRNTHHTLTMAASFEGLDALKQSVVQLCRMRPLRQPSRCRRVDGLMPMKIQMKRNTAGQKQAGKKKKPQKCDHGSSDLSLVGTGGSLIS
jgi:hypothetical protein